MMNLKTILFVPGNDMRMIAKATSLVSDAIILDLEDAEPLDTEGTARIMIRDAATGVKSGGAYVFARVKN